MNRPPQKHPADQSDATLAPDSLQGENQAGRSPGAGPSDPGTIHGGMDQTLSPDADERPKAAAQSDQTLAPDVMDPAPLARNSAHSTTILEHGIQADQADDGSTMADTPGARSALAGSDATLAPGALADESGATMPPPGGIDESDATMPPPGGIDESDATMPPPGEIDDSGATMPPPGEMDESDATMPPPGEMDESDATMPPPGETDDSGATVAPDQSRVMKTAAPSQGGKTVKGRNQASVTQIGLKGSTQAGKTLATAGASKPAGKGPAMPEVPGYELLGELGRGGMGVVYRARQLGLNRMVALKMVLNSQASESELDRFGLEARAVALVQHPNIVGVFDVGEYKGLPYMALEFVEGGPLDNRLKGEPQDPEFTARLMEQLCRAMGHAHSLNIIHRDLKPANILLTKEDLPKVTDFGLAKEMDADDGHTRAGSIMGTPSYMPPEQAEGKAKELTGLADIYSLGAMLYEFLTGRPPFKGRTLLETLEHVRKKEPVPPLDLNPGTPLDLQTIALKALEKDPAKRYQTANEMADDLAAYRRGDPIKARPISRLQKTVKWARRNKALASLAGMGAAFLLVVMAGSIALNAAYGVAERGRKALQDQINAGRDSGRDALQAGLAAKTERRFDDARLSLEGGLSNLETIAAGAVGGANADAEAELADLKHELETVLVEVRQHLATDQLLRNFDKKYDSAIFSHMNTLGLDPQAARDESRSQVSQAFALVNLDTEKNPPEPVFDQFFREEERGHIRQRCGELMVVLADTFADEKQVAEAIALLEKANSLIPLDKLLHLKLARYNLIGAKKGNPTELALADKNYKAELELAKAGKARTSLEWFLVGDEYFKERKYNEATASFREALLLDPQQFWSQYFLAVIALNDKNYMGAYSGFLVARALKPDFPFTDVMLAVSENKQERFDEARILFDRVQGKVGETAIFLVNRAASRFDEAESLVAKGNLEGAGKLYRAAEADLQTSLKNFSTRQARANLATILTRLGKDADAEALLRKLVEKSPNEDSASWANLARLVEKRAGKDPQLLQESAAAYQQASVLELNKEKKADLAVAAGKLLLQAGNFEGGRARLNEAVDADPKNAAAYLQLANLRFVQGMGMRKADPAQRETLAEAATAFRTYLDLDTSRKEVDRLNQAMAYERLGTLQARRGDMVSALASQTRAVELDPKAPSIRRVRGWNLMNQWRSAALADFEEGLVANPSPDDRVDMHLGRGYLLAQKGDIPGALADLKQIELMSKDKPMNMLNSATILAQVAAQQRKAGGLRSEAADKTVEAMATLISQCLEKVPAQSRSTIWTRYRADDGYDPVRELDAFKALDKKFLPPAKP